MVVTIGVDLHSRHGDISHLPNGGSITGALRVNIVVLVVCGRKTLGYRMDKRCSAAWRNDTGLMNL